MLILGLYVRKEVLNWVIDLHNGSNLLVLCFALTVKFTRPWRRVCMSIRMMTHLDFSSAPVALAGYLVICSVVEGRPKMLILDH